MTQRKNAVLLAVGVLVGAAIGSPIAHAAAEALMATPSAQTFYVDGQKVELTAYAVAGNNYVQLRELGKLVGFGWTIRHRTTPCASPPAPSPLRLVQRPSPRTAPSMFPRRGM